MTKKRRIMKTSNVRLEQNSGSSVFMRRVDELSTSSDIVWLIGVFISLGIIAGCSSLWPFSPNGRFWAYVICLSKTCLFLWAGNKLKGRGGEVLSGLFKFAIVAGMFEILVDWGLIHWISNGRLVYLSGNDVILLGSPIWMPFAWAVTIVDLGYGALRLFGALKKSISQKSATLITSVVTGILAGLLICVFEYCAYQLGWWKYEKANAMIGDYCALFIPLGEVIMFLFLLPIITRLFSHEDLKIDAYITGGVQFAVCIALGYTISYLLLEFGRIV